jgi:MFS family permease
LFGMVANIFFATTGSVVGMFVGQILMGVLWGIFASLGIIAAQRLLPTAVATASAIFMSSYSVSSALGGLTSGLGVGLVGLPNVFFIPALFASLASIGLVAMARSGVLKRTSAQPERCELKTQLSDEALKQDQSEIRTRDPECSLRNPKTCTESSS